MRLYVDMWVLHATLLALVKMTTLTFAGRDDAMRAWPFTQKWIESERSETRENTKQNVFVSDLYWSCNIVAYCLHCPGGFKNLQGSL